MDPQRTNWAIRNLLRAGLINSRVDGLDHIYYIHAQRFTVLKEFADSMTRGDAEKA